MLTTCTHGCRAEAGRDDLFHDLLLVVGQLCNRWDYGRRGPQVHRGLRVDGVDSSSQKAEVPEITPTGSLRPGLPDRSARHRTRGGGRESIGPREPEAPERCRWMRMSSAGHAATALSRPHRPVCTQPGRTITRWPPNQLVDQAQHAAGEASPAMVVVGARSHRPSRENGSRGRG
jgi:hypothetical protein